MDKKQCKHCKSEMSKKAKVCPTCGRSQSNKFVKFLIVILIIFGCIFGCTAACTKGVSDAIDEVENKKDYLKVEDNVTSSKDEYGMSYYIEGYVKNTSDKEKFDYVQITYTTYDAEGNTLGTCLDNNSGLEANGRWKFKAMCLTDVENIASYKLTEITGW